MTLTEQRQGKTHIQFFLGGICIGTVRVEYADAFRKAALEQINANANRVNKKEK